MDGQGELAGRLRARRTEVIEALFTRVHEDVRDPLGGDDAEYLAGLRGAVTAVFDHVLKGIEDGGEWSGPLPSAAVEQAQRAARGGVSLNTVLRRYVAGHALLGDFVMAEAEGMPGAAVRSTMGAQSRFLERLIGEVSAAYNEELERLRRTPEQHHAEIVRRLLAGETLDTGELGYDFDGWHLGMIATGEGAARALCALGGAVECRVLAIARGEQTVWAWLGGREPSQAAEVERLIAGERNAAGRAGGEQAQFPAGVSVAFGEPALGIEGWRLTHRQAQAALSVAQRRPRPFTAYADVALLATVLRDPATARQMIGLYMARLDGPDAAGEGLRETLRAYFRTGRNVSSAAAALGVERRTVAYRLRAIEERVGYRLETRLTELEVALRLFDLFEG